jgi:phosphatidate phosphatase PAH1
MYPFFLMVPGDGSSADGTVYAIAPATKAVLFDIDGTLTVDDGEMFEDLLGGHANAFPDANAVANRWATAGYLIVYTTGRPHFLRNYTKEWLTTNGFPPGPIFTVASLRQSLPTEAGVGAFKNALITKLIKEGLVFVRAYGNAATDACAYMRAGIAPTNVYMTNNLSRQCDGKKTQPLPSYTKHLQGLVIPPR